MKQASKNKIKHMSLLFASIILPPSPSPSLPYCTSNSSFWVCASPVHRLVGAVASSSQAFRSCCCCSLVSMATAQVPGMEAPLAGPVAAKKKTLMRAMVLESPLTPLKKVLVEVPEPACDQIRVRVLACAVCRTDLHVVDGDLKEPKLPIIPGHEIVGVIDAIGPAVDANRSPLGTRVGIPWLGRTCGSCFYCLEGAENLCDSPGFTGYQIDGGYAEYTVAHANYCFPLPDTYSDVEIAPFLCAGLIGYRSLKKTGFLSGEKSKKNIGIYGFGAAGHIIAQVAIFEGHGIYAFTRSGDTDAQKFALQLGARWAGDSATLPPVELDAAIIFAPVGSLIPAALRAVRKGGIVVAGGIHMSNIPSFPYSILWGERQVVSVANLKRQDAVEFLLLASKLPLKTETTVFPLEQANEALASLREGRLQGAAVLVP